MGDILQGKSYTNSLKSFPIRHSGVSQNPLLLLDLQFLTCENTFLHHYNYKIENAFTQLLA